MHAAGLTTATAYSLPASEVLRALQVDPGGGLAESEATDRRIRFGSNAIPTRKRIGALTILLHQLRSPVVFLLSTAAALAFWFGELEESVAIVSVLGLNTLIGFVTETRAARSIEALRALDRTSARVRRDGHTRVLPAEDLVPGDILLVEAGDAISADLRIVEASHLAADESTLTGESVPVDKSAKPTFQDARTSERTSMLFKGTVVTRGSGLGVAVATGARSELGRISHLVEEAEPESSPIERKLARLSGQLVWAVGLLTVLIAAVGIARGENAFLIMESSIALAVAAIPEGLPIVATLALARGMWRMARQNALLERLSAVETLGATTVILTDKTGTLTENRMAVRRLWVESGEVEKAGPREMAGDALLQRLLHTMVLCNEASLGHGDAAHSGDPMEVALLQAGRGAGLKRRELLRDFPIVAKHAFDTESKMMATVHQHGRAYFYAVKGAPEHVLAACTGIVTESGEIPLDHAARHLWSRRIAEFGQHGLRVLAGAIKTATSADAQPYRELIFVGLIGLEDPARADVPRAIRDFHNAGIRVVMVTGDHAVTARSIGLAIGLEADNIAEGGDIDRLIEGRPQELKRVGIFARVSPAEKLAIVRAYQASGDIVAMTGDGVNDAPALKQADIGVAMGLRGTDVARRAAAMILLDDAFPTILKAVQEGRTIFGNIRRFAAYLLSCNLAEVLVVGIAITAAFPLPILPLQILYLNLVTDVFPAFALAMGEAERDILNRPPRHPKEPILGRRQWTTIVLQSIALAGGAFTALGLALSAGWTADAVVTTTFLTIAFAQLWHVFDMRSSHSRVVANEITRNPWIWAAVGLCSALLAVPPYWPLAAEVLHVAPPTVAMWAIIVGCSLAPTLLIQVSSAMIVLANRDR
ncbi:cation-transporting P-type ATPase [Bradyrhizobium diazoefficiens]|nr:cation-transporting P-type ATPase [Bradyrhizobium diazoefficiens]MBR0701998.1 cation-transporting P-type ATPase [Bradyrhizobium diazoefficiens]MBR0770421.1 cation-transporting P-type ATPase [Bradyrhizobium diazoefficiens]